MRSPNYDRARIDLALELRTAGAIVTAAEEHPLLIRRGLERGFKLHRHIEHPDFPLSPIYLDLRTRDNPKPGPLSPRLVDWAGRCMRGVLDAEYVGFDAVVGVPHAGEPFADVVARLSGVPRLAHKKNSAGAPFAANGWMPARGARVLVVDDVITGGESKMRTIACMRQAGFAVTDVVVLVDREFGGIETLHRENVHVHAVYRLSEMITWYYAKGAISREMFDAIADYFQLRV